MKLNDLSLVIATVNGTGSQSANQILMRAFFKLRLPVGGKNVFPSNVQGLPTWYWLRVNEQGFVSRKPRADVLVAYNASTLLKDLESLEANGVVVVPDDLLPILGQTQAPITQRVISLKVKSLLDQTEAKPKAKKLLANMIYVGALARGLGVSWEILEESISSQFSGEILTINLNAARMAFEVAEDLPFKLQPPKNFTSKKLLMDGNTATALGAIDGGCSFVSWYPITPSSSIIENFNKWAPKLREKTADGKDSFVVIQAEDELASACMVMGAGWAGARSLTATSGPGLSLMQETIGYAYFTEAPGVIINVQRAGPSTGLPTRTQQSDLLSCIYASHGDTLTPVLMPGTVEECYEFARASLDLAEQLQQFVILLSDLDLGMNVWMCDELRPHVGPLKRGKVLSQEVLLGMGQFERYGDPDGDGIPYRTLPGNTAPLAPYFTRGSGHNAKAAYSENPAEYKFQLDRLRKKWETARSLVPEVEFAANDSRELLVVWGSTWAAMPEYLQLFEDKFGYRPSILRLRALPLTQLGKTKLQEYPKITVIEQNRDAQTKNVLARELEAMGCGEVALRLRSLLHYTGEPIAALSLLLTESGEA